ncbi:MAG TPA: hypothetical protein DCS07_05290 [Bdellovibrionales bacterium]|nr:MAG: hypothetical protein A2X97_02700 [Bdellovibrionales bacterium GWA1_52_35]HAR42034.1 hypothetical protein [Bdellovibrionales bacterium]HCM40101.1 hypothetical protein [Bdellovibrionales bacterium]
MNQTITQVFLTLFTLLTLSACGKVSINNRAPDLTATCTDAQTCTAIVGWDYVDSERARITGFKLYYGRISQTNHAFTGYEHELEIAPEAKTATVPNLGAIGRVYFSMTAYASPGSPICAEGCESPYSNEISIDFSTVPAGTVLTVQIEAN